MNPEMIATAWKAREQAYAPYSKFQVGACLRTASGKIFTGCNVENLSFGLTICAERNAIGAMIAAGETEVSEVVVVADTDQPISPCGACRQVLAEFGNPTIHMVCKTGQLTASLAELLPRAQTGILNRK